MASIDATTVPLQFSDDSGTTWQTVICLRNWTLNGVTPVNEDETFCGKVTGLGTPSYTGSASAVGEFSPSSTQVSLEEMQDWWFNKKALLFRAMSPSDTGADFYVGGDARITEFSPTAEVSGSLSWDFSFVVTNTVIVKPA